MNKTCHLGPITLYLFVSQTFYCVYDCLEEDCKLIASYFVVFCMSMWVRLCGCMPGCVNSEDYTTDRKNDFILTFPRRGKLDTFSCCDVAKRECIIQKKAC